jgi:putative oxidoreductase
LVAVIFTRSISYITNIGLLDAPRGPRLIAMTISPASSDSTHHGPGHHGPGMLERLLSTGSDRTLLAQRVALGLIMFPHGAQKLLGWFGGYGLSGTMGFFTGTMHLPAALALVIILAESIGAIALIAGAGTRVAALGIAAVMLGAIATTHLPNGFFMNWFGAQQGEGFEYHLLVLALAVPLVIRGGGALAIDGVIDRAIAARRGAVPPYAQPSRA